MNYRLKLRNGLSSCPIKENFHRACFIEEVKPYSLILIVIITSTIYDLIIYIYNIYVFMELFFVFVRHYSHLCHACVYFSDSHDFLKTCVANNSRFVCSSNNKIPFFKQTTICDFEIFRSLNRTYNLTSSSCGSRTSSWSKVQTDGRIVVNSVSSAVRQMSKSGRHKRELKLNRIEEAFENIEVRICNQAQINVWLLLYF